MKCELAFVRLPTYWHDTQPSPGWDCGSWRCKEPLSAGQPGDRAERQHQVAKKRVASTRSAQRKPDCSGKW